MKKNDIIKQIAESKNLIIKIFNSKFYKKSLTIYKNYSLQFNNNQLIEIDTRKNERIKKLFFFRIFK
jgi:hypothetical protein